MLFLENSKSFDKYNNDYSRAKELYFLNYACYWNMKRNGELNEYLRYQVPKALEYEWGEMIKEELLHKIYTGEDVWCVSNLANISLPEIEIVNSFRLLKSSPFIKDIRNAVEKSAVLISASLYDKIIVALT